MYAVIKTGGKQYRVAEGQTLKVERLDIEEGAEVSFEDVIMIVDGDNFKVGSTLPKSPKVTATVVTHGRHKKVQIIKFRRRKHHRKQMGHRQGFTQVRIDKIAAGK